MDSATIRRMFFFSRAKEEIVSGFGLPPEAFIPPMLSLRSCGDWSYATGEIRSVPVVAKTTVYDGERKAGRTKEEIFLITGPGIIREEGSVRRLEKCGGEETLPYEVKARGDRIIRADIDPDTLEIRVQELEGRNWSLPGLPSTHVPMKWSIWPGERFRAPGSVHSRTSESDENDTPPGDSQGTGLASQVRENNWCAGGEGEALSGSPHGYSMHFCRRTLTPRVPRWSLPDPLPDASRECPEAFVGRTWLYSGLPEVGLHMRLEEVVEDDC